MYRYQVLHRQKDENDLFVSSNSLNKLIKQQKEIQIRALIEILMLLLFWMWEVLEIIYINDFITKEEIKSRRKI